ncbi:sulfurtransferase TusA [Acinetobacter calcoaceticus]|uniref:Sulfurtransferase TusA n=1 Tax=Acinetobacter calcoaceticus TaxID=471 RepID=A0A4R1XTI5_ACICA|nr:sulfurtransferase TusA [Acinetobacter calcoaceticus]
MSQPIIIDALGQPCPMPLLMLKRELKKVATPCSVLLKSSDPHSEVDILRYCQLNHHVCQFIKISAQEFHYLIES